MGPRWRAPRWRRPRPRARWTASAPRCPRWPRARRCRSERQRSATTGRTWRACSTRSPRSWQSSLKPRPTATAPRSSGTCSWSWSTSGGSSGSRARRRSAPRTTSSAGGSVAWSAWRPNATSRCATSTSRPWTGSGPRRRSWSGRRPGRRPELIAGVVALLVASGGILVASTVAAAHLRPRGALAFLLALGLIAWASVELIVGVAGLVLRNLSPVALLASTFAYLAVVLLAARRRRLSLPLRTRLQALGAPIREAMASLPAAVATLLVGLSL